MQRFLKVISVCLAAALVGSAVPAQDAGGGPSILHDPVRIAPRGRPLGIMATVRPGDAPIERVTLHYAASRDASPMTLAMVRTGGNIYLGTIPTFHVAEGGELWYYIEAIDGQDEWAETAWHRILLQDADETERDRAPDETAPSDPVPMDAPPPPSRGPSTTTLVVGGALVAGGAIAIAAASSGGGGGGGGGDTGGDDPTRDCSFGDVVGTWSGSNPSVAPGFVLNNDLSAIFFDAQGGAPDSGGFGLVDCVLSLTPRSNDVYRGAGNLSADRTRVTINGNTFTKQ